MDEVLQAWAEARLAGLETGAAIQWTPLPVEASHRRFYRLTAAADGAAGVVAMASPPALENNSQFTALAELFFRHGIGVPRLIAADQDRGFFLMSDLGDVHFADAYRAGRTDAVLPEALATLARLQQVRDPVIPPYTRERFADELRLYETWFLGELLGQPAPGALDDVFEALLEATGAQPTCCVHRDFHCRNLLVGPDGTVGVVDFQDALMGPATYDLASLLRDCYHTFSEAEVAHWRDVYLSQTTLDVQRERFARDLDFVALQRQLKAVGIFVRLHRRDGRGSHLPHVMPVLTRIRDLAARYPATAPLAEHVAAVLPAARRRLEVTP